MTVIHWSEVVEMATQQAELLDTNMLAELSELAPSYFRSKVSDVTIVLDTREGWTEELHENIKLEVATATNDDMNPCSLLVTTG